MNADPDPVRIRILLKWEPSFPKVPVNKTIFLFHPTFLTLDIFRQSSLLIIQYDCIENINFHFFWSSGLIFIRADFTLLHCKCGSNADQDLAAEPKHWSALYFNLECQFCRKLSGSLTLCTAFLTPIYVIFLIREMKVVFILFES
jgi:hypothetical protein